MNTAGTFTLVFDVVDNSTSTGVSGVTVYAVPTGTAGSACTGTSDGNGEVNLSITTGDYQLTIKADGYTQVQQSYTMGVEDGAMGTVGLTKAAPPTQSITITGGTNGASYTITSADGTADESGTFDSTGTTTLDGVGSDGSVTIAQTLTGYNDDTQTCVTKAGVTSYAVNPMQKSVPSTGTPSTTVNPSTLPAVAAVPATSTSYEFVYPNSSAGKYFTTTQARMYIGNLFIDEFHDVQFALQGNRVPVYGYSSQDVDAFGKGKRLVQGQLGINFISEGYLYTVLNEYANYTDISTVNPDITTMTSLLGKKKALLTQMTQTKDTTSRTGLLAQLNQVNAQIDTMAYKLGPTGLDSAKLAVASSALKTQNYNAVYNDVPFDLVLEMQGAGRVVTRKLTGCLLTSNEQVYDQSGDGLRDVYGFVARRLT